MIKHRHINKITIIIIALCVIGLIVFINVPFKGLHYGPRTMGYESKLFDTSKVHKINIDIDNWADFIENAGSETYARCDLTIDGEYYPNVAIRGKGNTSLTNIEMMDSNRYSFKVEFDHYDSSNNYHGLDKLVLNNLIQDNSYMKDYLVYEMMRENNVPAPLVSYSYITVNHIDWGLYLNVEGIEDGFLERNYGSDSGELYKPDSDSLVAEPVEYVDLTEKAGPPERIKNRIARMSGIVDYLEPSALRLVSIPFRNGNNQLAYKRSLADNLNPIESLREKLQDTLLRNMKRDVVIARIEHTKDQIRALDLKKTPQYEHGNNDDIKLMYIDDNVSSYPNIFNSSKTGSTLTDQQRLINSIRKINSNMDLENTLDIRTLINYFVVHNFVVNEDSYTGPMIHNYYLYETRGKLSMIPWDYNLAFEGLGDNDSSRVVNAPIDTPVRMTDINNRPMIAWIFRSSQYTKQYHNAYLNFVTDTDVLSELEKTYVMIEPYVKNDPTKFVTVEEFNNGVKTLYALISLRQKSVLGQLEGRIPSTEDGQNADSSHLIDSSDISLVSLDSMIMRAVEFNNTLPIYGPEIPIEILTAKHYYIGSVEVPFSPDQFLSVLSFIIFMIAMFCVYKYQRIKY